MRIDQGFQQIKELVIEPRTGTALTIQRGQVLRVADIEGSQVVDLVSYRNRDPQQYLSSPRTMDYSNKVYFTTGDLLYSDQSEPMWTILDDSVGKHCFLFAPCDQKMFEITYGVTEPHPNCLDNLSGSLSPYGIKAQQIFIPFNIFMHAEIAKTGEIEIKPPLSNPGDFIELRAEMEMIVGISACSAYKSNDYTFSQIKLEIFSKDS